ncbi:hypothetical protein ACFQY5_29060 [Paeniroseomonas aquatica]|uniref:Flagellar protein FlgN n=1 Tax=Paeniroseomonas aquatica TaxID=373043 RepID=A0ABT8AC77_9PROT|nr:hypothetical protein [Paeniroseomonas aquatica]MDN3567387.1 hypothetical protein [Paeniroseomonas aquatica]
MMDALLAAGQRLAEALRAENEALAALDLPGAARLATLKMQAADAFAAAFATARKTGARMDGPERQAAAELTDQLQSLGEENRRLLERAIAIQSQVIETIAGAALPRSGTGSYGAAGRPAAGRQPPALAMTTRI